MKSGGRFFLALWALLMFVVLASSVPLGNVSADSGPETLAEARARQSAIKRKQLETQLQIDAANVEDAKLSDAFNTATILVERQEQLVKDARQQLDAAHDTFGQAEDKVKISEQKLRDHRERAKQIAIEGYLKIQDNNDSFLLSTKDINEGVKKRALLEIISTSVGDFNDQLRFIEDENRVASIIAEDALLFVVTKERQLREQLVVLEDYKAQLTLLRTELDKRRSKLQELLDAYESEEEAIEKLIKKLEDEQLSIEQAEYVWPTPGRLGGGFGPRFHPILKYWRPHNGIDVGGARGTPIFATNNGVVIVSSFGRGFGNYVVLNHGNGLTSIYAHMSRRLVTVGEEVSAGEEIGKVGSTGLSTGPHLHFEIREKGTPVNPLKYVSPPKS